LDTKAIPKKIRNEATVRFFYDYFYYFLFAFKTLLFQ
jgi:hypothetical protein